MANKEDSISTYVFRTAFGWSSITVTGGNVINVVLPGISSSLQLKNVNNFSLEPDELSKDVISRICLYFEGENVDFSAIPLNLPFGSEFSHGILDSCRKIPYGQIKSYGELANDAGFTNAARATGNILANNPLPLLIPCHRIVKADGNIGGFMKNIEGAADIKRKMLALEKPDRCFKE